MCVSNSKETVLESSREFTKPNYTDVSFWLIWLAITLVYIVIRINIVHIPLDRDEGLFGYMGQLILDGGLPYLDAFDHKPPVVFYLNALALLIVPPSPLGMHLFLHTYNFATLIALYFLAKKFARSSASGLWVAFIYGVFSSSPGILGFAASTEMFLLLPLTLSLLFAVLTVHKNKLYRPVLSGVFGALTFWTKQTAALVLLFVVLYLIFAQIHCSERKNLDLVKPLKSILLWSCGFLAASSMIVGYFYYHNALDKFIYCNFTYNFAYSARIKFTEVLPTYWLKTKEIVKGNFFVILAGLSVGVFYTLRKHTHGLFALGFFFLSILATIPGYAYWHYFAQLAPAVAIAGGLGFALLIANISNTKLRTLSSLLCAAAIVLIPVLVHSGYYIKKPPGEISRRYFGINPFPESIELAEFLANRTSSDDTIFIFGSEPQLFFYSQRKSATSYPYIYPLMSVYSGYREFQRKAWDEINTARPKYIVTVELPTSLAWDGKADLWLVKKTREIIAQRYTLEAMMTLGYPQGKLFILSKKDDVEKILNNHRVIIYILRSK